MITPDQVQLDNKTLDKIRAKGKESLFFFARGILGFSDFDINIHKPLCEKLQDSKNRRVIIILPRDWFKSSMGVIAYPIFLAINNPNIRILIVQNSMNNAMKKVQSIKQMFEKNKLLRALYPEILPTTKCTWTNSCLTLNRSGAYPEGTFEAAGTGTAVISRHYDLIVEDDTISPQKDEMTGIIQQPTQLEIEKAIGFHRLAHPLLLHPKKSKIVVIGTRWCERDLLAWIEKNSPEYIVLSRSARENGVPVWEDRYDEEVLGELEKSMGIYMFSTLFLNEPINNINAVFKREWLTDMYYQTMPKRDIEFCTSVDPASADAESSSDPDYTVVLTSCYDRKTGTIFIVQYDRERMNPGEQIDAIFRHYAAYKPMVVKVEAISYQRTLVYWLKKRQEKLNRLFYVEAIKGMKGSKIDRIRGLQPYFQNGKIKIKSNMGELERELLSFPNGAHDDIIDALSMHRDFWLKIGDEEVKYEEIENESNTFSGQSIINELLSRPKQYKGYPYDIGIARDAVKRKCLRSYVYD